MSVVLTSGSHGAAIEGAALEMFVPIVKVDEETRQVWGVASSEEFDRDGEIFDYETSKPFIQSWSDTQKSASDGKSFGNVREQHSRIAAGRIIALDMNDSKKMVGVGAEVVDDSTWEKVRKGVLTGFSWGGKYAKVWKDSGGKALRYTLAPAELSLVDRPAIPGATFQLVKADGTAETHKFAEADIFELAKSSKSVTETKAVENPLAEMEQVEKCMYHVSALAQEVATLHCLAASIQDEEEYEGDDSKLAGRLSSLVGEIGDVLVAYAEEEVAELQQAAAKGAGMTITAEDLEKAAKSHNKVAAAHHEAMAKHHTAMAAAHDKFATHYHAEHGQEATAGGAKEKSEQDKIEAAKTAAAEAAKAELAKAAAEGNPLAKTVADIAEGQKELADAVKNISEAFTKFMEAPAAPRAIVNAGGLRVVSKTEDGGGETKTIETELAKAQAITDPTQRADAVAKVTLRYGARAV
jgi:hypothetical protein